MFILQWNGESQRKEDVELEHGAESVGEGSEHVFDGDTWQKFEQLSEGLSDKLLEMLKVLGNLHIIEAVRVSLILNLMTERSQDH